MKVVCDTNVLVSGVLFQGNARTLLQWVSKVERSSASRPFFPGRQQPQFLYLFDQTPDDDAQETYGQRQLAYQYSSIHPLLLNFPRKGIIFSPSKTRTRLRSELQVV